VSPGPPQPQAIVELIRFNGDGTADVPGGRISLNGQILTTTSTGTYTTPTPVDKGCESTLTFDSPGNPALYIFIPPQAETLQMILINSNNCVPRSSNEGVELTPGHIAWSRRGSIHAELNSWVKPEQTKGGLAAPASANPVVYGCGESDSNRFCQRISGTGHELALRRLRTLEDLDRLTLDDDELARQPADCDRTGRRDDRGGRRSRDEDLVARPQLGD
jgi:hypothetical protein